MEFNKDLLYCEMCFEEIDDYENTDEGYTLCCNELTVGGREAQRLYNKYYGEDDDE